MASPNAVFTELVSTTFRKHRKEIKDNVSTRIALLRYMKRRGNTITEDGGLTIASFASTAAVRASSTSPRRASKTRCGRSTTTSLRTCTRPAR
jgi:hypothetical protein